MTNYEKIKNMSFEEMVNEIYTQFGGCGVCKYKDGFLCNSPKRPLHCEKKAIKRWLNKEVSK